MRASRGCPKAPLQRRRAPSEPQELATAEAWEKHLDTLGIATERHRRIATEGGLARRLAGARTFHRLGHRQRWCRTVCDSAAMPCAGFTPNALFTS